MLEDQEGNPPKYEFENIEHEKVQPLTDMPLAIDARNIRKRYTKGVDFMIVDRFQVPQGSICGLVGENGAGKSTLIQILMTLLSKDSGDIEYFGKREKSIKNISHKVGYTPDIPVFYERFTVSDYFIFLANIYGLDHEARNLRIRDFTKYFKLEEYHDKFICNLSLGLKKKFPLLPPCSMIPN